ncbi:MAG: cellulase family glycosylhydrolase [Prevotella sp.]|nr:cellulase family glycosylhydrolase [Prevotella sp.]
MLGGKAMYAEGTLSPLHVEGPFLVNAEGRRVNLHGFAQTFSPWFNERGTKWTDYDVNGCLNYNKGIIDGIMKAGWKMTFVRQHMDPYWSNTPGASQTYGNSWQGEADIRAFDFERFKTYLDLVFIPMAEYAIGKGLYVVMRPPGVCPENISVGGEYHQYLKKVWGYVAQHPKLKNNGAILFELANEPISIQGTRDRDIEMTQFMQEIVDLMRQYCNNILLIPGLVWQQHYNGFVKYPVLGENIGYAVHCYPGWYNSGVEDDVEVEYRDFKRGWDDNILPIATKAPVVVTEMDWAPKKYGASWGKATTGVEGGKGFGANFMRICDETCNVSWLLFTGGELLAQYDDAAPDGETFLTDPEACPRPVYRKYQYYATQEYSDLINQPDYKPTIKQQPPFSLTEEWLNPNIWEKGTFDETTGCLKTGQWGFGGWQYSSGLDISDYKYLVVELKQQQSCGASFRLFDVNNYWDKPAMYDFGSNTRLLIDLHQMKNEQGRAIDPSHIYIAGFWTTGASPIYIKDIFLSNDGVTSLEESLVPGFSPDAEVSYYSLDGRKTDGPQRGMNMVKVTETNGKTTIMKVCYRK